MAADTDGVLEELRTLVAQELKAVTYKWLARHFNLHVNTAKQLLERFAQQHAGKFQITHLVSGLSKASGQRISRLVDAVDLAGGAESELDPVTSNHVFSVAPPGPKSGLPAWQVNYAQSQELMGGLLAAGGAGMEGDDAQLASFTQAACSAVRGPPGTRLALRPPTRPPLAPVENKEEAAKATGAPSGAAGVRGAPASTAPPARAAPRAQPTAAAAAADGPSGSAEPAAAAPGAISGSGSAGPPTKGGFFTAKGSSAKSGSAVVRPAGQKTSATGAAPASQAVATPSAPASVAAHVVDEEDVVVAKRSGKKRNRQLVALSDEEDGVPQARTTAPAKAAGAASAAPAPAGPAKAKEAGTSKPSSAAAATSSPGEVVAQGPERPSGPSEASGPPAKVPKPSGVKRGKAKAAGEGGAGRKKGSGGGEGGPAHKGSGQAGAVSSRKPRTVTVVTFNEKGEEITEEREVGEGEEGAEPSAPIPPSAPVPAPTAPAPAAKPTPPPAAEPAPVRPAAASPSGPKTAATGGRASGKQAGKPSGKQLSISNFFKK